MLLRGGGSARAADLACCSTSGWEHKYSTGSGALRSFRGHQAATGHEMGLLPQKAQQRVLYFPMLTIVVQVWAGNTVSGH